ncbi:hypothetical protein [Wolbachia endosymbiont (group A) of Volucella inflata]|nr:hypothetical protein [Wolbachia endosymbiont (group A) of Volucella inflata]
MSTEPREGGSTSVLRSNKFLSSLSCKPGAFGKIGGAPSLSFCRFTDA